jgi:hypothetical protein
MTTKLKDALFAFVASAAVTVTSNVFADPIPPGWLAHNMEPIGYLDSQDRYSIKLTIKQTDDGRWLLYRIYSKTADGDPAALTIIDVTDPTDPVQIQQIDIIADGNSGQLSLYGDLLITHVSRPLTLYDTTHAINFMSEFTPNPPAADKLKDEGVILWDISDPTEPKELSRWQAGAWGTHRNIYPGGQYAYLASSSPGYRGMILRILDVSDPENPTEVGRWSQFGQKPGEERQDGVIPSFHGPAIISPDGNTAVLAYTPDVVSLDISDISNPKVIGRVQIVPPFVNNVTQSVHTVIPYWERDLLYVNGEPKQLNCKESLSANIMVDNSDPENPYMISVFPVPAPPADYPWDNFCDRPGRFGPHNTNNEIHNPDVAQPGDLIHLAYFNAGVRVYDISDPRLPAEVGWFLPGDPAEPKRSQSGMLPISITQEVLIDTRGNIFAVDSSGVYVLRNSGELVGR